MYLLDTNICSYSMKRRYPALIDRIRGFAPGELKVSVITVYELEYGVKRSGRSGIRKVIEAFLQNVEIILLDAKAAREAGAIRAHLSLARTPIGAYDLLIAGHARSLDAVLVSHKTKEFSRVPDLRLEDWVEASS